MKNIYFLTIPILAAVICSVLILNYDLLDIKKDEQTSALTYEMLIKNGSPILGDQSAEITILEFGDYQCTFCYKSVSYTHLTLPTIYSV